jgi:hypothetical protein
MSARTLGAVALAIGIALAGCGGGHDTTAPDPVPPTNDPGTPPPTPGQGVQGSYVLEQINQSQPGQLVTIANPDGTVIGLYRFAATTITLDALQTFQLSLSFTDDKSQYQLDDEGEFKPAGPASQGALPFTFYSKTYGDSFTGIVLGDVVAIEYDFDGDGRPDTRLAFRRND